MDSINEVAFEPQGGARTIASLYTCIEEISRYPKTAEQKLQTMKTTLQNVAEEDRLNALIKEAGKPCRLGETVLHTAIKLFSCRAEVEKELIRLLVSEFPKLVLQDRADTEYAGQTPLHMAVCKGTIWIVNVILEELSKSKNKHWRAALFKKRANGGIFQNTVMMGELPLSIAALTFNKGMFDLLVEKGAEIDGVNRFGDTLCHSLIKYAYLYKDKLPDVHEMCRYVSEDPTPFETSGKAIRNRKLRKKMWAMENEDGLSPLRLAAKLGQHELFGFIMNLEVYCWENSKDGLFDIKIHDVTEIDAIASMKQDDITGSDSKALKHTLPENITVRVATKSQSKPNTKSILMLLLELDPTTAFHFLQFPTLRRIIDRKWYAYRILFYLWWLIHFTFVCFLTWYAVERAQQNFNSGTKFDVTQKPEFRNRTSQDAFVTTLGVISLLVSVFYFTQEIIRTVKRKMSWTLTSFVNPYSNGWFRAMFVLLGLCLVVDFVASIWSDYYENYCLIVAVIFAWFTIIFFLRVIRPFSFFTVLIQKVLVGDMLRFFVVLALELIAFSTAMYMVIQGSEVSNDTDFSDYGRVLFSMFKLMVGLGEVAALYNTRHPEIAIVIFVVFVIMTTLLMLNSLIALMSRTCSELVENVGNISARDRHWKLQRLSVILFIESILPINMVVKVGKEMEILRYNNRIHRRKKMKRYMLEVRSLEDERHEVSDEVAVSSWGFRTAVFNALRNKHSTQGDRERPSSGVSEKLRQLFQQRSSSKQKSKRTRRWPGLNAGTDKEEAIEIPTNKETENHVQRQVLPLNDFPSKRQSPGPEPRLGPGQAPGHAGQGQGHIAGHGSGQGPAVLEIYSISKCESCSDCQVSGSNC